MANSFYGLIFVVKKRTKLLTMKRNKILSLFTIVLFGLFACNDNSKTSAANEDSSNGSVTTNTSSGNYAAQADEFEKNSAAGKYLDVRTGKPIKISVDRTTGVKTNVETSTPVVRYIYIDDPDWWVYDAEGNRLSRAKMENNTLLFEDNNNWVSYDVKWKSDEDGAKLKSGDSKTKTDKGGDTKAKTDSTKLKNQ